MDNKYCVPHLEWESISYPLVVTQVRFERFSDCFGSDTEIVIWRNEDYKFQATISGSVNDISILKEDFFIGKGNIIKGQIITGIDSLGNKVSLSECLIIGFNSERINSFTSKLIFDCININFVSKSNILHTERTRLDWFLCTSKLPHFTATTLRNLKLPLKKIRVGIDLFDDSIENYFGGSASKDYISIDLPNLKCIIAKVPDILAENVHGICFEFRQDSVDINEELLNNLKSFISFLLGMRLHSIGYSIIEDGMLTESFMKSPEEFILNKTNAAMPPIHYNLTYEWGKIEAVINNLLPEYLALQGELKLNSIIERYWIAKNISIGANLPVLASAIEILAEQYLRKTKNNKLEYLSEDEYNHLIGDKIEELKTKLKLVTGGDIIINKIVGANRKGPNEKLLVFFSLIGIEIGKMEKEAISLRNKMAHGSRDYLNDDTAYNDLLLTRVYEVLFNRVLLKVLKYDGYYIDYSTMRSPSRYINSKITEIV